MLYRIPARTYCEIWLDAEMHPEGHKAWVGHTEIEVVYGDHEKYSDDAIRIYKLNPQWYWFRMPQMFHGGNVIVVPHHLVKMIGDDPSSPKNFNGSISTNGYNIYTNSV